MSYADLVLKLLDKQQLAFDTIQAPDAVSLRVDWLEQTVPIGSVAKLAILQDKHGIVLAFYPATHMIDLKELRNTLRRDLSLIDTAHAEKKFLSDVQSPKFNINTENGWRVIIDDNLLQRDFIHLEAPGSCKIIRISSEDFQHIAADVLLGCSFAEVQTRNTPSQNNIRLPLDLKQRIAKLDKLPAMPDMPARILAIRSDPDSTVEDLVKIIETDMSLTAQIIRYANSAMFVHDKPVESLKDAIFRVLGYETVLHLSLGYALGKVFKLPESGPLGKEGFWQHSIYSGALMHRLVYAIPQGHRPKAGLAYMSGLLHDIGFLVLNLFFKSEHAWFNKLLEANPDKSIVEVEKRLIGTTHNELGAWLMKAWDMPQELIVTVEHHHNPDYNGPHAVYAQLMNLTERLLKTHGMSDAETDEIPDELLETLLLNEDDIYLIMDEVLQGSSTLKTMVNAIAC